MSKGSAIHPVILCGGSGTRLWPLSVPERPKPFLPLIGGETLFEQAIGRLEGSVHFAEPIIVAGAHHADLIEEQMRGRAHRLIIEPAAKNTAPAIALAAAYLPPEAVMLVCPSDHHIARPDAFHQAAIAAGELALQDYLVAFGIAPDRPETGYGYIRRGDAISGGFAIAEFVEKPDQTRAKEYLASGEYSWNGGIFAFRAGTFLAELAAHRPAMAAAVADAISARKDEGALIHPDPQAFAAIEGESIDYAVMENTGRAAMVPADMGWSDIGNWAALQDALAPSQHSEDDNVAHGQVNFADCRNVMARTDSLRVSAVGLEDVVIVVANGEVLVTTRNGAQAVGKLPGAKGL